MRLTRCRRGPAAATHPPLGDPVLAAAKRDSQLFVNARRRVATGHELALYLHLTRNSDDVLDRSYSGRCSCPGDWSRTSNLSAEDIRDAHGLHVDHETFKALGR